MTTRIMESQTSHSPLEDFLRDYVETVGGAWEEVEPQVYDVLLPAEGMAAAFDAGGRSVVRVAFDPEALPEHPGSQLASFGTPLVNGILTDAVQRGRFAKFYLIGLNLTPHDLAGQIRRALRLPAEVKMRLERARPMHFPQAVLWFEASFVSDQKEQEMLPVAMDLHYGRHVRHLDQLLDRARLAERPALPLPEVRRSGLATIYPAARERALRTFATMANTRNRELSERLERQIARMTRYYADLRAEVQEQLDRASSRSEDLSKLTGRCAAVDREERLRVAELRQKGTLQVRLRLLIALLIQQPKLLLHGSAATAQRELTLPELVWDPLTESLEAPPCPECGQPTFAWDLTRFGRLVCPRCVSSSRKPPASPRGTPPSRTNGGT